VGRHHADVTEVAEPLVVTVLLDAASQERFDGERRALFPPGRTAVGAHVTLFHALPGAERAAVAADLDRAADRPAFGIRVTGLLPLGRGVAYRLAAPELAAVHAQLRARWHPWLTRQDQQPFRPHVTVQNKVTPEEARRTLATLSAGFVPFDAGATGLALWAYRGGPWAPLSRHPFR
jgi:2'-5' RNA ligase